jgi:hypothetical protein
VDKEEVEQIISENMRLKNALHDEDKKWKERLEAKVDAIFAKCTNCPIEDLKKTVFGNGTPGLKATVNELQEVIMGRGAKDSGLRGKVETLSTAYLKARGGWRMLVLETGILVTLVTIAIQVWEKVSASNDRPASRDISVVSHDKDAVK